MCEHVETCVLFKKLELDVSKRVYAERYCKNNGEGCARRERKNKGEEVHPGLLPTGEQIWVAL